MKENLVITFLLISFLSVQAQERSTKGADNGYAWNSMSNPLIIFDDSKYNYVGGILQQYSLLKQNFPEVEKLGCGDEVGALQMQNKSDEISLDDMVTAIDKFYRNPENLRIPVIFAYCYCIKQKAGLSKKELADYRNELLMFSDE